MAAFVFIGYPWSVLQSLCPSDPGLHVLSNDVPDVWVRVYSSISKGMIDKVLRLTPEVDLRALRFTANTKLCKKGLVWYTSVSLC